MEVKQKKEAQKRWKEAMNKCSKRLPRHGPEDSVLSSRALSLPRHSRKRHRKSPLPPSIPNCSLWYVENMEQGKVEHLHCLCLHFQQSPENSRGKGEVMCRLCRVRVLTRGRKVLPIGWEGKRIDGHMYFSVCCKKQTNLWLCSIVTTSVAV